MRRFGLVVLLSGLAFGWSTPEAAIYSDWSAPVNLGTAVNSATTDIAPAVSRDELSLYFASTRAGGLGAFDLWVSQRATRADAWGAPVNLGATINTGVNDQGAALSGDGHLLFFVSDRAGGSGGQDIWVSWRAHTRDDFAWQPPVNLGSGVNSMSNDHGPGYFDDEDTGVPLLYFGSDRPGGPGLDDIYVSAQTRRGTFGLATLVEELSTPDADVGPDIRRDGREILFHSNRAGSLGLFDIWVSIREPVHDWPPRGVELPRWSPPENIGAIVNSTFTEAQPMMSADRISLYFFSNRPGGVGGADLWVTTRAHLHGHRGDGHAD